LETAFKAHFSLPYHIASAILECKTKPFLLHISSDQVYSGPGLHKESLSAPINCYGLTKLMGEKPALEAKGTVLRTNFFGRSLTKKRDSITDWIYKTISSQPSIRGFTDVHFSPIGIDSLCSAINKILQQRPNDVYNLGASTAASKAEFIDLFCQQFPEFKPKIILEKISNAQLLAPRPQDMRMDCSKISNALSIKTNELEEEIIRESKHYK
jgi:dTDP-4-dehydrorhamnose reductase